MKKIVLLLLFVSAPLAWAAAQRAQDTKQPVREHTTEAEYTIQVPQERVNDVTSVLQALQNKQVVRHYSVQGSSVQVTTDAEVSEQKLRRYLRLD